MTAFVASYLNECYKLYSRKKYLVFLACGMLLSIIWSELGMMVGDYLIWTEIGTELEFLLDDLIYWTGLDMLFGDFITMIGAQPVHAPTPLGALPFYQYLVLPIIVFVCSCDLITTEAAEKTMRSIISRPVERWKIYAAKNAATVSYVALYLLAIFLTTATMSTLFGRTLSGADLLHALAAYALSLVPLAALAAFAALLALGGANPSSTFSLLLFSYALLHALPILIPATSELLFTAYLGWHRLWLGARPASGKLLQMVLVLLSSLATFFLLGTLVFERKDY